MTQQEFAFVADRKFVLLLRASIRQALPKAIGASAFTIFILLTAESDLETGAATLTYETMQRLTGFSRVTIGAALKRLTEEGLIESEDINGRGLKRYYCKHIVPFAQVKPGQNPYELLQQIEDPATTNQVEYTGQAEFRHIPRKMTHTRQEIVEFLTTGQQPRYNIEIKHFHVSININNAEAISEEVEDPDIKAALLRLVGKSKERAVAMSGVKVLPSPAGKPKKPRST